MLCRCKLCSDTHAFLVRRATTAPLSTTYLNTPCLGGYFGGVGQSSPTCSGQCSAVRQLRVLPATPLCRHVMLCSLLHCRATARPVLRQARRPCVVAWAPTVQRGLPRPSPSARAPTSTLCPEQALRLSRRLALRTAPLTVPALAGSLSVDLSSSPRLTLRVYTVALRCLLQLPGVIFSAGCTGGTGTATVYNAQTNTNSGPTITATTQNYVGGVTWAVTSVVPADGSCNVTAASIT